MNPKIFISHAVKDRGIVTELVQFLEHGLNIPSEMIFCSSIPGDGIPAGEQFVTYIKREIANKDVIVLPLLTENYLRSVFSLCELGATWALENKWIPLMVPPLEYKDLTAVLTGVQVYNLQTPENIGLLRDELEKLLPQIKDNSRIEYGRWEHTKQTFIEKIRHLATHKLPEPVEQAESDDHDVTESTEFYDKIAEYYDRGVSADFIQTHRALNRVIGRRIASRPSTQVLDLGGGTGRILSAFDSVDNLTWHYCDASSKMRDVFTSAFHSSKVVSRVICNDAEMFLRTDGLQYDIIILSFLISSMSYPIDFQLLKKRLSNSGLLVIVEANPTYSETKPKFTIKEQAAGGHAYSLRIKPVDAPTLATRASIVGLEIKDLIGYEKGSKPYSYIATFEIGKQIGTDF